MQIDLLSGGYVRFVEAWGSDERIIEAARMSTGKGFLGWGTAEKPGDEKLLRFLYENRHSTPFEMGGMVVEVQAPIFVFREWHRHRTQSYNEMSARYVQMPDLHFVPAADRVRKQDAKNKQGTSSAPLAIEIVDEWLRRIEAEQRLVYETYEWAIAHEIPRELARINTPVSRYSKMRASSNLRNWLGFITLRSAPNAQEEIRVYSDAIASMLDEHFPRTMSLFREGAR